MFDKRITIARLEKGLNKTQLARAVGVSKPAVTKWEKGQDEPSPENWRKIAVTLGKPVSWFKQDELPSDEIIRRLEALEGKLPAKSPPAPSASIDGVVAQIEALFDGGRLSLRKRALILALLKSDPSYLEGLDESQSRIARALLKAL